MKNFPFAPTPLVAKGLLLTTCCLLLAPACSLPAPQSDLVRYYTLAGPAGTPAALEGTRVQPVQVAGYLHNRSMAVRIAENEIIYLEDVRWAESLAEGITQTLRNRLAPIASDAVVKVQIQRCELNRAAGNTVQLVASYTITSGGAGAPVESRGLFNATAHVWDGKEHSTLVTLLQEAVGELADRLVSQLAEKTN